MNYQSTLHLGDNLATLKNYPDNTFDSIVTDPPYGIDFLGKEWDSHTGTVELYKECLSSPEQPVTDIELEKFKQQWDGKSPIPARILHYGLDKAIAHSNKMIKSTDNGLFEDLFE